MKGPPPASSNLALGLGGFSPGFHDRNALGPLLPQPFFDPFADAAPGPWDLSGPSMDGQVVPMRNSRRRLQAAREAQDLEPAGHVAPIESHDFGLPLNGFPFQNPVLDQGSAFVSPRAWIRSNRSNFVGPHHLPTVPLQTTSNESPVLEHWMSLRAHTVPPDHDDLTILKSKDMKPASKTHAISTLEVIRLAVVAKDRAAELGDQDFKYSIQAKTVKELAFALFNEIDALCFYGVLRGNVYLKWGFKMAPGVLGRTKRPPQSGSRIEIWLSDTLCADGDPEALLGVMVHQMTHAFLLQCCEPKSDKDPAYRHQLNHDPTFSAVSFAAQKAMRTQPLAYPSLLGCNAAFANEPVLMSSDPSHITARKHSHCSEEDPGKPLDECDTVLMQVKQRVEAPKMKLDKGCAKDDSGRLL